MKSVKGIVCFILLVSFSVLCFENVSSAVELHVFKSKRVMELWSKEKKLHTYAISLGAHPIGHKQMEGDERTPEGTYAIIFKNEHSRYHLSLKLSYPSDQDKKVAENKGLNPGGDIMIHGLPNGLGFIGKLHTWWDWTDGCIAVTNQEIEEVWNLVDLNTPVIIYQ